MDSKELIADIAKRIGLEYDGGDTFSFEADGLVVAISSLPELDAVVLTGDVGEPPPERLEGLYKTLLGANHLFGGTAGATISLDPDTGRIALCRALPLMTLDGEKFYAEVERFVNTAETWAKVVADYRGAAAEAPDEGAAEERPAFGAGGFMQV